MATEQAQLKSPNVQAAIANLGQNRKMVFIGAGVVTIILAIVIIVFATAKSNDRGEQIILVKALEQDRAFEIVSKLKTADIEGKIEDNEQPGKVDLKVYEKDFDKAALTLARSDLLQDEGFNLFDKSDWAASDYDKRIKMMRAVNGDLSRIVSRMTGIKWATVRVNIPEPQLFSQYQAATTSTVQVELPEDYTKLTRAQVRSIINLLVGYVPNLQKNNISIIDTNGETYSTVDSEEIAASELLEESERVNKIVQKRIEEYLAPLIGTGSFIVRVSSEISRKKTEESSTTFAEGVVGQEQTADERLGGEGQANGAALAGADGSMSYLKSNRVTQKYPSFKQKTVSTPAGRISKIAVAVAIDSEILPRISTKQLREGIAAITSPNTTASDIKITVAEFARERVPSTHTQAKKPALPAFNFGNLGPQIAELVNKTPMWAKIAIIVVGLLMFVGSMRKPQARPVQQIEPSTISQINQAMTQQQQFQRPEAQISANPLPEIRQEKEPDLTGILTGLQEAATEKPEFLASKLQIWLEEGIPTR